MTNKGKVKKTQVKYIYNQGAIENNVVYAFLGIITLIMMSIFAYNNSPLVERLGEDGGIYLLMGKNLTQGGILYKSLFDHKGPIIFFINALPQLIIKGPFGVWCLEVICMFISVRVLYQLAYKLVKTPSAVLVPMIYLWGTCLFLAGGNYTEEFGNLFCILSLAIFINWIEGEKKELTSSQAYILGVYLSLVFFMRPNNIALIAVVIGFIGIYTLKYMPNKAGRYIVYGILGIVTISLPLFLYHFQQGNTLEMLNATILHNLRYCGEGITTMRRSMRLDSPFKRGIFFYLCISLYAFIRCKIYKDNLYAIFLGASTVVVLLSVVIGGREYIHYLVIAMPVVALASMLILKHATKDLKKFLSLRLNLVILVAIALMSYNCYSIGKPFERRSIIKDYKDQAKVLGAYIPEEERNQVFGYDVPAMWFYINDMMPCYNYFTMQSWMAKSDLTIEEGVNHFVTSQRPKWIVTYYEAAGNNHYLLNEIQEDYEKVAENSSGYLYRRKE